jgi:hypothetical protein
MREVEERRQKGPCFERAAVHELRHWNDFGSCGIGFDVYASDRTVRRAQVDAHRKPVSFAVAALRAD